MTLPGPEPVPEVTAVVLAFGPEPWLVESVEAVLASTCVRADVVVVDNGAGGDGVALLDGRPGVRVLRPGRNTGFAGGVRLGAELVRTPFLALVNSDAVVEPGALAALVDEAARPDVGIASACVVLADQPWLVNTVGNPLHVLGFAWAGGMGTPVDDHQETADIACATGACAVMRTTWWIESGGFAPEYFAYHEDVDLSWRTWQRGLTVRYVPQAVARHHYEFSRSSTKHYLLERNRLVFVLTTYERRTLLGLAPLLAGVELALLLVALRGGWARQKVAGWRWLWANRGWVARRRREVQRVRTRSDLDLVDRWTTRFDPGHEATPPGAAVAGAVTTVWWRGVRRMLLAGSPDRAR